jgi:hypothetical protein
MIKVFAVKSHHSGFGQYQCECEGVEYGFDSAEEYCTWVVSENNTIRLYAVDPDVAEMGDEDGERLAAKLREVSGNVLGGHGLLVAFMIGDEIQVESVDVIPQAD